MLSVSSKIFNELCKAEALLGRSLGAALFRKLKARGSSYAVCGSVVPRATAYTASRSAREFSPKIFIKGN